jgi:hypothetical protein
MPQTHSFSALLFKGGDEANASFFIEIPPEVSADFGKKGQVKVKVTIKDYSYRSSIAPYGGKHLLGIRKEIRDAIGIKSGDMITVTLEVDTDPRMVEVPDDLAQEMAAHEGTRAFFDKLSYTHQKEYAEWITGAKREETRQRRLKKTIEMMQAGVKTPHR